MTSDHNLKTQLLRACNEKLENKLNRIQSKIQDIQTALQSETKSSAGDKHETGRAMLQIERKKLTNQLVEIRNLQNILKQIDPSFKQDIIGLGSAVFTTLHNYFISASFGEIKIDDSQFYAISTKSPIGKTVLGKSQGQSFKFRENSFTILKVL